MFFYYPNNAHTNEILKPVLLERNLKKKLKNPLELEDKIQFYRLI
jgi:hypothetical protein